MSLIPLWKKIWNTWKFWQEIRCQRRELLKLDDRILKDIGISRVDAEREANRPFWDVVGEKDATLRKRNPPKNFNTDNEEILECCSCPHGESRCKI
jgi:uncharacterized protein YjiS (DUF1127 family)